MPVSPAATASANALSKSAPVTLTPASVPSTAVMSDTVSGLIVPFACLRLAMRESMEGPPEAATSSSSRGGIGGPLG